jgi:hypothetical protein
VKAIISKPVQNTIGHVQNRYTSEQLEGKTRSINMRTDDNLGVSAVSNLDSNLTEEGGRCVSWCCAMVHAVCRQGNLRLFGDFHETNYLHFIEIIWMCSRLFVTIIALVPLDNHWEPLLSDCSAWARVNQHPCWYLHLFE